MTLKRYQKGNVMSGFNTTVHTKPIFWRMCLVLCLFLLLWTKHSQAQTDLEEQYKDSIAAFIDAAYNNGNTSMLTSLFAPNYTFHPGGYDITRLHINILSLRAAMPDLRATQVIRIAEGDWVAVHAIMEGTFSHEFISPNAAPLPPTNQPLQFVTNMVFHFDQQGQVYEQWVTFDNFAYLAQLEIIDFEFVPWQGSTEAVVLYPVSDTENNHRLAALQYYDGFNRRDVSILQPLLGSSFMGINPFGSLNRDEQLGDLNSLFGAFPDLGVRVDALVVDGVYAAVLYNIHGTFSQEFVFADIPPFQPTNNSLDLIRIDFLHFNQQGQIDKTVEIYDTFDFMLQLGLFIPEG